MKNLTILILFIFSFNFTKGQTTIDADCTFLQEAIASSIFKINFKIEDSLILTDTLLNYNDCKLGLNNKKVSIKKTMDFSPNKKTGKEFKSEVVIYKIEQTKNSCTIGFWQPYTNYSLLLQVKKCSTKFKFKIIGEGVF